MEKKYISDTNFKVLNRDTIKYVAMVTMLLNHIAHVFLISGTMLYEVFEDIGYFTAPVMCFFLVEGYEHTRSRTKYGLRLLIFAAISQIPYTLAFRFGNLNMIFTLLCCFLILMSMDRIENQLLRMIVCMILTLATAVSDWGLIAPICTILVHNGKDNPKKMAFGYGIVYVMFVVFNVQNYMYGVQGNWTMYAVVHALISGAGIIAAAVTVLVLYNGKRAERGRSFSKWFFYIFYPGHLLILYLIKMGQNILSDIGV
ncbi:MAG: conjugal transfer protein TraX [Lachnospiraceae bacterium]|nr:conjugal transfer protein TraX [Lachnospiraceae bacterium]